MNEMIGMWRPGDFANFVLRAKLSRRWGIFGKIPMWGGVRLHKYYPPLSTLLVRFLTMRGAVVLYLLSVFAVFSIYRSPYIATLFIISYFHWKPFMRIGRYAEFLGYSLVAAAIFSKSSAVSGILLGLAGLAYPLPLIFGGFIFLLKQEWVVLGVAFIVCAWWYLPFFVNRRKLSFLQEKRSDKILGIYDIQWLNMANLALFLFAPLWICLIAGAGLWLFSFNFANHQLRLAGFGYIIRRFKKFFILKPFTYKHLLELMPKLQDITEPSIVIKQPPSGGGLASEDDQFSGSLKHWVWSAASYLIDRNVVVYNGLPSTEVEGDKIVMPEDIKVYTVFDLGMSPEEVKLK